MMWFLAIFTVLCGAVSLLTPATAAEWQLRLLDTGQPIVEIRTDQKGGVHARSQRGWREVRADKDRVCIQANHARPHWVPIPSGGLVDGEVGRSDLKGGIRKGWLGEPTRRYRHGVIGDDVEAGSVMAIDDSGTAHVFRPAGESVFEDRLVRLANVDGRPGAEVVIVESNGERGARVVVLGLRNGQLVQITASPPIGRGYRWLNPVGIADFDGDGRMDIAVVRTPHIGGILEIWRYREGELQRVAHRPGYSNHWIGSRALRVSAIADMNGDNRPDILLPDQAKTKLKAVSVGRAITPIASINLPGRINSAIGILGAGNRPPVFAFAVADGRLAFLRSGYLSQPVICAAQ